MPLYFVVKKLLVEERTKDKIKVSKRIKTLLLLALDFFDRFWRLASLSCFLVELAKRLSQEFY